MICPIHCFSYAANWRSSATTLRAREDDLQVGRPYLSDKISRETNHPMKWRKSLVMLRIIRAAIRELSEDHPIAIRWPSDRTASDNSPSRTSKTGV